MVSPEFPGIVPGIVPGISPEFPGISEFSMVSPEFPGIPEFVVNAHIYFFLMLSVRHHRRRAALFDSEQLRGQLHKLEPGFDKAFFVFAE